MNKEEYEYLEKKFNEYYKPFKNKSRGIILKYGHSFNVADYMEELADRLDLNDADKYLAKAIGLLHDIGRFEQLIRFNSFDDNLFDHAEFAVKYLFEDNNIRNFIKDSKNDNVIKEAIRNHNKIRIEDGLNERELLFAKMIRDMDKTDIYYQIAVKYPLQFIDKPTDIVVESFFNEEPIDKNEKKNKSDNIVLELGFISDYNFDESLDILRESDNLGLYLSCVEVSKENEELFNKIVKKCYEIAGLGDYYVE